MPVKAASGKVPVRNLLLKSACLKARANPEKNKPVTHFLFLKIMKKKNLLNFILITMLLSLIALSNCSYDRGDPNGDKDGTGNHANTPPGAPASEYPGNSHDSTSNAAHMDTLHHE